jgi:hypothetical protein
MATRFYLHNDAAPYTPATFRGAWDKTSQQVTKLIDASKYPTTTETYAQGSEDVSTDEYDVLIFRGVSGKLKAGTIGTGTVNVMLGVDTTSTDANTHFHLHIYVTQGDSDTPRGTLLSDYREAAGVNEWSTDFNTCAKALNAAQSLSSVTVSDNDRIVVEIGATFRNTSTTTYYASCRYGGDGWRRDLVAGDQGSAGRGYIEFSENIQTLEVARVTQGPVETLLTETTATARVSQGAIQVLGLFDNDSRVTQLIAEVMGPSVLPTRVTQVVAEVLAPVTVEARVTQLTAELLNAQLNPTRVSQFVVELLGKMPSYCGPPSLSPAALCGKPDVLAWLEWTVPIKES